ncbi:redoxin family protein [uncultured Sphingomonas sp.]|uniref:redoxin family protein n=1 Tax=uncultured Sphingomonas sp. TaxID=158754 RepID=UPI0025E4AA51|nr:redoxin family protein [uncultured Sphingomonas sp.]
MNGRRILWLPLAAFILLSSGLVYGLARPENRIITSKVVSARVPDFALPAAVDTLPGLASADLATGQPHLLNIFASWCIPCISEAPQLKRMADAGVPIMGIAVRDRPEAVARFLRRHGNPFQRIGGDGDSQVQVAFGSSGVPESFIVDGKGRIVQQVIGPINPADVDAMVAAMKAAR